MTEKNFEIVEAPIDERAVSNKVKHANAGAVTLFLGTVREMTRGKRTLHLEYQAYRPMAEKMLARIGDEIQEKWPGTLAAITHRIGHLKIEDTAVVIAVSSPHRQAAYEANEYAIKRIKEMVPIWKKEYWEDGTRWIGDQRETTPYSQGAPKKESLKDD